MTIPEMTDLEREILTADWRDVPKGYYALQIHRIDLDDDLDECADESYEIVGYRVYHRKVSRVTTTGRRIGRDAWVGRIVAHEDTDRDLLNAYARKRDELLDKKFDVHLILMNPALAQAEYGRWSGRCGCCGRTLTDPASKMRGIGPECAKAS